MSRETPLQKMKRLHGGKDKLIEAVVKALKSLDADAEDLDERLAGAPNTRLLRLLDAATAVQERYGSKDKLVDAICAAEGKGKDSDYRARLAADPIPKLLDQATASERRARQGKVKVERGKKSRKSKAA